MKKALLLLSILPVSLCATLFLPIDETAVSSIELSSFFQNRIVVEGERIEQVIHPGCDVDINLNEEIGQLFIYPLTYNPQPVSVTIVTDQGHVQDFAFSFTDKASEIVVLHVPSLPTIEETEDLSSDPSCLARSRIAAVQGIVEGNIPQGWVVVESSLKRCTIKPGVDARLLSQLISVEETLSVWCIKNRSRKSKKLSEKEINLSCGEWVFLDKNYLKKGEETLAIVGARNR